MGPSLILAGLLVASTAAAAHAPRAATATSAATTVLVGQSWLGLWRMGRVVVSRPVPGWTFGASRLSRDGRTVEVAASRITAHASDGTILRFDARSLVPRGRIIDATLANAEVRAPIGVDPDVPDDRRALGQFHPDSRPTVPAGARVVLSPEGSAIAMFRQPARAGAAWQGTATRPGGSPLVAPGMTIDDGLARENGAARSVACLLPRGEGVIFTYVGPPADQVSEFQAFGGRPGPVALHTPYVMSCLSRG